MELCALLLSIALIANLIFHIYRENAIRTHLDLGQNNSYTTNNNLIIFPDNYPL